MLRDLTDSTLWVGYATKAIMIWSISIKVPAETPKRSHKKGDEGLYITVKRAERNSENRVWTRGSIQNSLN